MLTVGAHIHDFSTLSLLIFYFENAASKFADCLTIVGLLSKG